MTSSSSSLRTRLGKVKGLGSAHHGTGHWWLQRVTAVALIPLTLWFLSSLLCVMLSADFAEAALWFSSPLNAIVTVLMLLALFMHAKLGMQVVIEDYVKHPFVKYLLLLGNIFVCFLFAAISVVAVLRLHLLDIVSRGV